MAAGSCHPFPSFQWWSDMAYVPKKNTPHLKRTGIINLTRALFFKSNWQLLNRPVFSHTSSPRFSSCGLSIKHDLCSLIGFSCSFFMGRGIACFPSLCTGHRKTNAPISPLQELFMQLAFLAQNIRSKICTFFYPAFSSSSCLWSFQGSIGRAISLLSIKRYYTILLACLAHMRVAH